MTAELTREHLADPACNCARCRAVFEEWGEACTGFKRWLTPEMAERFFVVSSVTTSQEET